MREITKSQARVLRFIREFCEERGFPPTHKEIAEGLGFSSPNAAGEHLRLLVKKGVVAVEPGVSRGLRIVEDAETPSPRARHALAKGPAQTRGRVSGLELPLIGHVAAGQPILAEANVERTVTVDSELFRSRADYLLRVRGDSMIEAGILPGDLVAVSRASRVRDGQVAVVRLDDEVTVKRWHTKGRGDGLRVVLEPANAALKPMVFDPRRVHVAVEGLVVGLVRSTLSIRGHVS